MNRQALVGRIATVLAAILLAALVTLGSLYALLALTTPEPRSTPAWTLGAPLPEERGELATAVVHAEPCDEPPCPELERLYVLGGLAGLGRTEDRVARFDPTTEAWQEAPPLPAPRHHLAAVGHEGAVYATGGTVGPTEPWAPAATFWRLGVGADEWESLPSMPEGRWGHRMVAHEGRLYVVGGEGATSNVLAYDPDDPDGGWEVRAEMPEPRDHVSAVVADDRIWVLGGRAPQSLARVDLYDPQADVWEPGPDLPEPTSGAAEGVVDGRILVLGGEEPALGGGVFDRHWILDPGRAEPTWEPAPAPPLAVHGADGAVFQETLVIVGGASRHGILSVTSWTDAFQRMDPGTLD